MVNTILRNEILHSAYCLKNPTQISSFSWKYSCTEMFLFPSTGIWMSLRFFHLDVLFYSLKLREKTTWAQNKIKRDCLITADLPENASFNTERHIRDEVLSLSTWIHNMLSNMLISLLSQYMCNFILTRSDTLKISLDNSCFHEEKQ